MILLSDPTVAAISVAENNDPLVDLCEVDELLVDPRLADDAGTYAMLRHGVVSRLLTAQRSLPPGLRLLIIEGYRPLAEQRGLFTECQDELRVLHPHWDPDRVYIEASRYISPPVVAPHSTGGAVDLTLCTADGTELNCGTQVSVTPLVSGDACYTAAAGISARARRNRELLRVSLTIAGLVNYPTKWWHWSYGDRYWARSTGAVCARYGPVVLSRSTRTARVPA